MRVAVYARVSRDRDGRSTSVDQQVTECRKYAEARGWEVSVVLSDNDISAYTGKRRPAYERLLEMIEAGEVDALIIWSQDRLTRRPLELEGFISATEPRNIPTYSVTGGEMDLTTSVGRMQARIAGAVNRNEVDQLRDRVKRGMKSRAARGEPVGGRRPFGFESDRVTHRPVEADALRDACESLVAGDSVHGVARRWRTQGLVTTAGNAWSPGQLRALFRRPRNAGLAEHRGSILGPAQWKPIVSVDTWSRVCAILDDPSRRVSPGNQPAYLGTFIFRCGVCGLPMRSWRSGAKGTRIYRCTATERTEPHPTIPIAPTDEYVADFLVRGLHEQGFSLVPGTETVSDGVDPTAELEQRRSALVRAFTSGQIPQGDFDQGLALISAQLEELERAEVPAPVTSDLTDLATEQTTWEELPLDRQRATVAESADVVIGLSQYHRQPVSERVTVTLNLSV